MYKTIILDLDGPLLDGKWRHYQCYADIAAQLNFQPLTLENYWQLKRAGTNQREILQLSHAADHYALFLQKWLQQIEEKKYLQLDRLQPQIISILQNWRLQNIKLLLVTLRHNLDHLVWQLTELGLHPLLDQIITVKEGDVKAEQIKAFIVEQDFKNILWIGDTEIDIRAARKLNIKICAVSSGLRDGNFLKKWQPDYLVDTIYSFVDSDARNIQ